MARLIDANKFGMYLADLQLTHSGWKEDVYEVLEDVMSELNEQPTVEAVPVEVYEAVKAERDRLKEETKTLGDKNQLNQIYTDELADKLAERLMLLAGRETGMDDLRF